MAQSFRAHVLAEIVKREIRESEWVAPAIKIHDPGKNGEHQKHARGSETFADRFADDEEQSKRRVEADAEGYSRQQSEAGAERHQTEGSCRELVSCGQAVHGQPHES